MSDNADKGIRAAQAGVLTNTLLALAKLLAGLVGNSYALIADAVESGADVFSSLVVMSGLKIARREATADFPYGYGRAETLATAVVGLMLLGAAIGIAIEAIREIVTPHHAPAPWTLLVLVAVIAVKWLVSRRVHAVGVEIGSNAVAADAWHHLSDALTSAAAFVGISLALWGGPGWEPADDWAALAATCIIAFNGAKILRSALVDLMDAAPRGDVLDEIRAVAAAVPGVLAIEKLLVRRAGMEYHAAIHVQAAPTMSLDEAHALGGRVKAAIQRQLPQVADVLVHMEPFHESRHDPVAVVAATGDQP
ncbi:MAG: cation transporter [Pirellulales bacterium]|nr:cation transporter [Pirellulales bacterium]